jgi:MoaA/NifB/PqqE/SkfB family radical SAM enzyme
MQITDHIHWFMTNRCNLDCVYCFAPKFPKNCNESPERIREITSSIVGLGARVVTLTGGEPTLVKAMPEALEVFRRAGVYVQLHTNATTLNRERIARLKPYLGDMAIPIDSVDPDIQKELRGIDYLPKFWEVLEELESQRMNFNLHTVATLLNLDGFPRLYNSLRNYQFRHWRVYEFNETMVGNRFSGIERFQKVQDLRYLSGEISDEDRRRGDTNCLLAKLLLMEERMKKKRDRRLQFVAQRDRGKPYCFLDNSGDVRYCTYFSRERTVVGNVLKDGIGKVKRKIEAALREGILFDEEGFIEVEQDLPLFARLWQGNFWTEEVEGFGDAQDESERGIDGRSWPRINHLYDLYRKRILRNEGRLMKAGYGALVP